MNTPLQFDQLSVTQGSANATHLCYKPGTHEFVQTYKHLYIYIIYTSCMGPGRCGPGSWAADQDPPWAPTHLRCVHFQCACAYIYIYIYIYTYSFFLYIFMGTRSTEQAVALIHIDTPCCRIAFHGCPRALNDVGPEQAICVFH